MSFELLCLVVLAYLVFGPRKLPEMARIFAKTMAEIRRAGNEFRYSLEDEIRKIDAEAKAPSKQMEPAPGVAGAVARPDSSAAPAMSTPGSEPEAALDESPDAIRGAYGTDDAPEFARDYEEQWYESDEDWEQNAAPEELTPEPGAVPGTAPVDAATVASPEAVPESAPAAPEPAHRTSV